ncbi:hypothetical protein C7S13_5960 [Burkholderia cepacia]|nr:hypothetical protein [Burkholderia cepacia]
MHRHAERARHGFIGHAPACASCHAAGRNNDNGNTAAIITSRIDVVAPARPGQHVEETG